MPEERITESELAELSDTWLQRLDENLAAASYTAEELNEIAAHQRTLAQVTDDAGQRRAALTIAERYDRAARERAPVGQ